MFRLPLKDLFQQNIIYILSVLLIVHVGSVLSLFIIKRINPYFKNFTIMYGGKKLIATENVVQSDKSIPKENQQHNYKNLINETNSICSSDEEFSTALDSLKSLIEVFDSPEKESSICSSCREKDSLNIETSTIDRNVENISSDSIHEKLSSKAQTTITIDPKLFLSQPDSNSIVSKLPSDTSIEITLHKPSSYLAASHSSGGDKTDKVTDVNKKLLDEEYGKSIEGNKNNSTTESVMLNKYLAENDNLIHANFGRNVTQENKILETAIKEFERELKPVKDQIQKLKKCLFVLENGYSKHCPSSDVSSSDTENVWLSDNLTETLSTTCTSSLYSCVSSHHSVIEKNPLSYEYLVKIRKREMLHGIKSDVRLSNKRSDVKHKVPLDDNSKHCSQVELAPEPYTATKKLSPVAEMYVELSQNRSRSNYQYSKGKQSLTPYYVSGKTVTCHINVNVCVNSVSALNDSKTSFFNEPTVSPILSSPEDVFSHLYYPCISQIGSQKK